MANAKRGKTLPEIMRAVGAKRGPVERLLQDLEWRIGPPERFGLVRVWANEAVEVLRAALQEEARRREMSR